MNAEDLGKTLHRLERAILPLIPKNPTAEELIIVSGLQEVEVIRALQWLSNKSLLTLTGSKTEQIVLANETAEQIVQNGLPERRLLNALSDQFQPVDTLIQRAKLSNQELNISIGMLKQKAAIEITKTDGLQIKLTDQGKKIKEKEWLEEVFLHSPFPKIESKLTPEEKFGYDLLKKRGLLKIETKKKINVKITPQGKKVAAGLTTTAYEEKLTPEMLKNRTWKGKEFRAFDVSINVPSRPRGKRHFVGGALRYVKQVWLDMGFEEMTGTMVQSSFWNFDALFTAQDHPVRDLQDTFYLKKPNRSKLPNDKLVQDVKTMHETGGKIPSTGWNYAWDPKDAKRTVLRTHTTALSAQTLAKLDIKDLPKKYFSLGKCFRNESLDWSHLFEFYQTDCIVIDENANLRHLLGYLKQFFIKMGFEKVRFRPAHFPYTEPSVEVDVYHPKHKTWIELGGAGVFRPEVVVPLLGKDIPVLAWGLGFPRIISDYYKLNDIRQLYRNDLQQVREMKEWML